MFGLTQRSPAVKGYRMAKRDPGRDGACRGHFERRGAGVSTRRVAPLGSGGRVRRRATRFVLGANACRLGGRRVDFFRGEKSCGLYRALARTLPQ